MSSNNKPSGFYKRLYAGTSQSLFFPSHQNQSQGPNNGCKQSTAESSLLHELPSNGLRKNLLQQASNKHSRKIFVGGLPPDIVEDEIKASFKQFGSHIIDWPCKSGTKSYCPPRGYTFIMFDHESSVEHLLHGCAKFENKYYIYVSSTKIKDKPVEVRPWLLSDEDYISDVSKTLDPRKTAFVANLPCPIKAGDLAAAVKVLYGGVCYVGIDVDPVYKYPKTTGRITFDCAESYRAVINARFVKIKNSVATKEVDIKPYILNDQKCDVCLGSLCKSKYAPYFCTNVSCLKYYCEKCWDPVHVEITKKNHKPILLGESEFTSTKSMLFNSDCCNNYYK